MASPVCNQLLVISAIFVNSIAHGMCAVYFGVLLKSISMVFTTVDDLKNDPFNFVGPVIEVGGVIGITSSAMMMKYLGRRITYAVCIIPGIIFWVIAYFATDATSILIGLFFISLSAGGTTTLGPIVIGEFSSPRHRGIFITINILIILLSITLGSLLLFFLQLSIPLYVGLVSHIMALLLVYMWPESPLWLSSKRRFEKSERAFYWLRGDSEESVKELEEMMNTYKAFDPKPKSKMSVWRKAAKFLLRFTARKFLEPLQIMLAVNVLIQITGKDFLITVMPMMVDNLAHTHIVFDRILTLSSLVTTIISIILVRSIKRRSMIFSTGVVAFATLILTFIYLCYMQTNVLNNHPEVAIWLVGIYCAVSSVGFAPLSVILVGELFPLAHKGVGSAASGISICVLRLIVRKSLENPKAHSIWSLTIIILAYTIAMGVCLAVLYMKLPETKDKTLQEIEKYYRKGHVNFFAHTKTRNDHFELIESYTE